MGRPWGGRDPIQPLHSEATGENAHGVSDHTLDVHGISASVCEPGDYQTGLGWLVWLVLRGGHCRKISPPTETTLMYAERNAWRKIHDLVHGGESLAAAMKNIKTDLLFWTREVYERVTKAAAKGHTAKGKGKTKNTPRPALSVYQPQWEKPRKGDQKGSPPKGGGKTQSKGQKGKTKGKPDWPAHWAFRSPKQVSYCRDFHLYKTCEGQCGRSHNCPVRVNGWICDAPPSQRSAAECPHKPKWQASPSGAAGPEKGRTQGSVATAPTPEGIKVERTPPRGQSNTPTFTWMNHIPPRLQERLTWQQVDTSQITTPVILLLYSGKDDAGSLDACIHAYHPHFHVISVGNRRDPGNDMLQDHPYNLFCSLASQGQILLVCGGPNCRTWSILRWFPKPNAPPPVRGRSEAEVWGLEALTDQAQRDVDDDSILMLRQFYLTSLTYQGLEQRHPPIKGGSWVEHPSDPSTSSSIWNTQAYKLWAKHLKHRQVNFDECMLGQVSAKPTTISTDLELAHWRQMFCQHDRHQVDPGLKSSDLSRYPWDMMRGLAQAISNHCTPLLSQHTQQVTGIGIPPGVTAQAASPKTVSGRTPPPENQAKRPWQDHIGETVEGSPKTPPKKQRPEIRMSPEKSRSAAGVAAIATLTAGAKGENTSPEEPTTAHLEAWDRPTVVPRAGMVDLRDPVVQLNLAFKMRPLRDGGGKPSMGRLPPSRRPRSSLQFWRSPRNG